jgi:peroxiredoxin
MSMTSTKSRRAALAALAAGALAIGFAMTTTSKANVQTGNLAPGFTATDSNGKEHSLAAYKGKTVILEWTNHECPYTVKHYVTGNMQELQKSATGDGAVWLTVVSSKPGSQGHVNGLEANKLTDDRKAVPTAVLLDPKGGLGKLFGASTTPHMYIIDKAGMLVYAGAIDDNSSSSQSSVKGARNYVREALSAMAAGKPIQTASTRPYGCSVKY